MQTVHGMRILMNNLAVGFNVVRWMWKVTILRDTALAARSALAFCPYRQSRWTLFVRYRDYHVTCCPSPQPQQLADADSVCVLHTSVAVGSCRRCHRDLAVNTCNELLFA